MTFFNSVLLPFQDYYSSYETGQSVGGAKTGESREKPPDTPASRTWLVSHMFSAGHELIRERSWSLGLGAGVGGGAGSRLGLVIGQ